MTQGCGEPALTIAKLAPTCHVVATDLAPGMIPVANRRGEGVANFRSFGRTLQTHGLQDVIVAWRQFSGWESIPARPAVKVHAGQSTSGA
jgi:hypothetical protein